MNTAEIQVATSDEAVHVKVSGRATFACCQCLRGFVLRQLEEKRSLFQFELAQCESMDSTFMGILAMVAQRTAPLDGYVEIQNAGDKIRRSLDGLGIARLFRFATTNTSGEPWEALNESPEGTESARKAMRATMVQAHEALGNANPDNIYKFKDVLDFLKEEEEQENEG